MNDFIDLKQRLKDTTDNKLDAHLNDDLNEEDSIYTDRNRNVISYPTVSAIPNKKQLPSINSNGNRLSLATIGRSKTSPDDLNSIKKSQNKVYENTENTESKSKFEQHSDTDKSNNDKDLNNNANEIIYSIETVLKYLEEDFYLR